MPHLYSIRISARIIVANAIITGNFDSADFRQSSTTANSEPCCTSRRPIGPNRFSLSTNGGHDTTINLGDHDRITLATFSSRSAGKQFHHQLDRRYRSISGEKVFKFRRSGFQFPLRTGPYYGPRGGARRQAPSVPECRHIGYLAKLMRGIRTGRLLGCGRL
jgi:hypothetical protein